MKKSLLASAVMLAFASSAVHAVTYDKQYDFAGTLDLSTVGNELIVNSPSSSWATFPSKAFEIGIDKNVGKIEVTGKTAMLLGANGSMTADSIYMEGTSSNCVTLYGDLVLTGNTIALHSVYNTVQIDDKSASMTINGGDVTITADQHIALHGANGGSISVTADKLTINAPKAVQVMSTDSSVNVEATVAMVDGDIINRGTNTSMNFKMDKGVLKGRVVEASTGTGESTLTLGEEATWVLTDGNVNNYGSGETPFYGAGLGDSNVHNLNVEGTIDMSQVDRNITVLNVMTGDATIKVDATKTNTLTVEGEATGSVVVVTDQNADEVTKEQAAAMVTRMGGVEATASVAEGMYNGAMNVGVDGTVDAKVNSVMSNVLDMASVQSVSLNRVLMNDVRKRLGDLRSAEGTHGAWIRYDGGKLSGANEYENDFTTVQVGIDTVPVADAPRFGVAFAYTKSDADMARGGADMDAFSLAFYGTKMYDNGMFVDVIGRMATADTDVTVDGDKKGSMDNVALSLSGEFGWRFDVTEKFYFEPQAELTYTYVNADNLVLNSGHEYAFDAVDSLVGRVGFAAGFKCPNNFGNVYVRASAVHEFLGDATVRGGSNVHEIDGEDTWVEFGVGANFNVGKNVYVYADVERTEGAKLEEDWRANVGVRYAF